eukprot:6214028-Pleurochrysis_carterae.AAC.6
MCAFPAKPHGIRAAAADIAPRGQRGRELTTSRTATPASTAAAFGAARLFEAGSAGAGCAPTWTTSGPRRRRHSRWRLSTARL